MRRGRNQIGRLSTDGTDTDPRTRDIIGAAMEVHKQLGHGFAEPVYQEALAIEFATRGIPFRREVEIEIRYKGVVRECRYKPDFMCFEEIIVDIKA